MTVDPAGIFVAVFAGIGIGFFYFGGLWWTLKQLPFRSQAALWVFGSLFVRLAVALPGFYLAAAGDWMRFAACLAGFVAARAVLVRRIRPA